MGHRNSSPAPRWTGPLCGCLRRGVHEASCRVGEPVKLRSCPHLGCGPLDLEERGRHYRCPCPPLGGQL